MDRLTQAALISDLFFNYENTNYKQAFEDNNGSAPQEAVDTAIAADAKIFAGHYFKLFSQLPGMEQATEASFAEWLHGDFMRRL